MVQKQSAGVLLYRRRRGGVEVLVAHPGGPFWRHRDEGAWSIPKGEIDPGEDAEMAARREFAEETGVAVPGPLLSLGSVRLRSGKVVHGYAAELDLDPSAVRSNLVAVRWPPGSEGSIEVPEIDRVAWVGPAVARAKLNPAQAPFVDRLLTALGAGSTVDHSS